VNFALEKAEVTAPGGTVDRETLTQAVRSAVSNFESRAGCGILTRVGEHDLVIGNAQMMGESQIDTSPADARHADVTASGATLAYVAIDGALSGLFALTDPLRPASAAAIARLKAMGVETVMLSGDNQAVVARIGAALGLERPQAVEAFRPCVKFGPERDPDRREQKKCTAN
jgi:Cu+-exporting ATPase